MDNGSATMLQSGKVRGSATRVLAGLLLLAVFAVAGLSGCRQEDGEKPVAAALSDDAAAHPGDPAAEGQDSAVPADSREGAIVAEESVDGAAIDTDGAPASQSAGPAVVVFDPDNGDELIRTRVEAGELLEQPADPVREGYSFVGWISRDVHGVERGPDHPDKEKEFWDFSRDAVDGDLRLIARWVAGSFALAYEGNEHTDGTVPPAVGAEYGDPLRIAAPEGIAREEFRFSGWNTAPDGEGVDYAPGIKVNMPAENLTLYAQWEAIEYTLGYLGGAADSGSPPEPRQGAYGVEFTVADAGTLSRTGYRFTGWGVEPAGRGERYAPGDALEMPSAGLDLYAQWEPIEHVVSFESRLPVTDAMRVVHYNDTISEPVVEVPPGYTLAGWVTDADRDRYWDFSSDTVAGDMELQAVWRIDLVPVEGGRFRRETGSSVMTAVSDFAIGRYMVTQRQYEEVAGTQNPSYFTRRDAENRPVDRVSWYDAVVFCNMASILEGLEPVYSLKGSRNPDDWGEVPAGDDSVWSTIAADWSATGYRLPTEAEWQWAAMGGRDEPAKQFAGDDGSGADVGDYAWYRDNAGETLPGGEDHTAFGTHPVGTLLPNELGIHDMSGNLREWVWDWFQAYPDEPWTDPRGPESGQVKAVRGGSWSNHAANLTPAFRYIRSPGYRNYLYGFRVARRGGSGITR